PQAGRTRVWFPSRYGVQVASEWPELRGRRPPRLVSDPVAVRLRVGHTLTVTETGLQFLLDARRRDETCWPLDFLPEVHHSIGSGEAVIPDALIYYQRAHRDGGDGAMLRAFLEVDRATMGPERLAAKLGAYARYHRYVPVPAGGGRRRTVEAVQGGGEEWRRRYPLFPRLLFVLDATGPAGVENRIQALQAAAQADAVAGFLREVPVMAATFCDLLQHGPAAAMWRPVQRPEGRVSWMDNPQP
ncbi:replication-relaxation family protein, partial [Streptomyces sp. NPDC059618]|uniref:replication-relaxation family protein n=1 Tax=Streptomyces sp. NPDC059618 TaxID=3346887 RepID=UPI00369FCBAB